MSTPLTYGLVLEGQDAIDFENYQKHPTYTKAGIEVMREALRRQREDEGRME